MHTAETASQRSPNFENINLLATVASSRNHSTATPRKRQKYTNTNAIYKKCRNLNALLCKTRKKMQNYRRKLNQVQEKYVNLLNTFQELNISELEKLTQDGDSHAVFLVDQLKALSKKKPRWSEISVRFCILWHSRAPNGYRFIRNLGILKLPSESTLKKYLGHGLCDTGFSSLIKQRLQVEKINCKESELLGSLIIDEMSIKPKLTYDKKRDRLIGTISMEGLEKEVGVENVLANRLLCFVYSAINSSFRMPVAYYFTKQLQGNQQYILLRHVLTEVEKTGFKVIRIVTDNNKINTVMFKELCNGEIKSNIPHPCDPQRILFLSYDYCHVIKNIRNQFLSTKKCFIIDGENVSSSYIRKLYEMQKNNIIKPVRNLTRKHIFPTNFEKMNVKRAIEIFSPNVTAVLKFLAKQDPHFKTADKTIEFMETIYRWFSLHNIHNKVQYIHKNEPDVMHFFSISDERLIWLEDNFIAFIKSWRQQCENPKIHCLSDETYNATILTTQSTVDCIRHLLNEGVHYILTRKFSSDYIESFFGLIRLLGGTNDTTDALAASNAITKILKTGIVSRTTTGNVLSNDTYTASSNLKPFSYNQPSLCNDQNFLLFWEDKMKDTLSLLEKSNSTVLTSVHSATIAVLGGYLVRAVDDNIQCPECCSLLCSPETCAPSFMIIRNLDRGGLKYPKLEFVNILIILDKCVKEILENSDLKSEVSKKLSSLFLPRLCKNPLFNCLRSPDGSHVTEICTVVLKKFLNPYITNYANKCTEENNNLSYKKISRRPLSRKILKI